MLTAVAAISSARPIIATRAATAFSRLPIPATRAFASTNNSWITKKSTTAKISDRVLRTGFGDSGSGGLFFGIDMTRECSNFLIQAASKYHLRTELVHIGDATNAPYGGKSHEAIAGLTGGLVRHMATEEDCQVAIIACNTASTTYDPTMKAAMETAYPDVTVHEIIDPTAKTLRRLARPIQNAQGAIETHIGILATRATTLSQRYHVVLADLHKQEYGNNAVTVIINNDPFIKDKLTTDHSFKFTRVFKGDRPLVRGSNEEREVFRRVRENLVDTPVQFIHVHAPKNWVSIIECKGAAAEMTPAARHELLTHEVETEIKNFVAYAHDFYRGYTDSPLEGLSVVGLCCTHYPYVQQQIKAELLKYNVKGVAVVSQGATFGKYIYQPMMQKWIDVNNIPLRENPIPIQQVLAPKFTSYTTVNPANPHDMESARELPKLAALIDSSIASRIIYKTMPPITLTKSDQ